MIRWCYKTVHYELKKEGFLGAAFLDESEVEQSLNEYGQAGWELVSITETQDGLIAVFKQPLDPVAQSQPQEVSPHTEVERKSPKPELIEEDDIIEEKKPDEDPPENDLNTIRIE